MATNQLRTVGDGTATTAVKPGLVLAVTCVAQLLTILDETVVNVALPSISSSLKFAHPSSLAWVVDAYMLLFGGFLVLGGRGADILGRRRVFVAGVGLFVAASLVSGFAQTPVMLIVARGAQGLGAALMSPAALSILITVFREPADRAKALGIWGGLTGVSGVTGVLLGGVLTDLINWQWIFFINVPIGLILIALTVTRIPSSLGEHERGSTSLDLPGAVLVCGAMLLLVYSVISTSRRAWSDPITIAGLVAAAVLLAAFIVRELRIPQPLIRIGMVVRRTVGFANLTMVLGAAGLYGVFFFLSLYFQIVLGWSPLRAGVSWVPLGLCIATFSGAVLQLLPRVGVRALLVVGLLLAAGGQLMFLRTTPDGTYLGQVLPALVMCGCGYGLALVPIVNAAVAKVRADESGAASGLINTSQQVGGALGLAVFATLATSHLEDRLAAHTPRPDALVSSFHVAFGAAAVCTVVGAVLALALPALRGKVDLERLSGV